jgi:hypothetical protein
VAHRQLFFRHLEREKILSLKTFFRLKMNPIPRKSQGRIVVTSLEQGCQMVPKIPIWVKFGGPLI